MTEALLGFGGNLGDVRTTLDRAVAAYCDGDTVRLLARSSDYRTPPWGKTDQPPFTNLCIAVETALTPHVLLERGLATEDTFGRDRATEPMWGPRPLDIDILAYGDLVSDEPWLTLPHPRLLERAFVLAPLVEIRPNLVIRGTRIGDALRALDRNGIERLPARADA